MSKTKSLKSFLFTAKSIVKGTKLFSYCLKERIKILILSIFLTLYFMMSFSILPAETELIFQSLPKLIVSFIVVFFVILNVNIYLLNYKIKTKAPKKIKHLFLIILAFSFLLVAALHLAGYSIGTSSDIANQYEQAITGEYNNWHPVAHTILFYKIPIMIFGETINNVVLFQHLFLAAILSYLVYSLYKFGHKAHIIIMVVALMLINSTFRYIIKFPWKDIPYSFSLLFLIINLMWIYFTQGEWLKKKFSIVLFVLSSLLVIFLRHNGVMAFIPTAVVLIVSYKDIRKLATFLSVSILTLYFVISVPLYGFLDIQKHSQSFAESVGVPNNMICYIIKNYGDVSEEENEFISNILPISIIRNFYEDGNFNSIKWRKNQAGTAYYYNGDFIENNREEYLKTWLNIVMKNKKLSFEAYYYATKPLWGSEIIVSDSFSYSVGLGFFVATFLMVVSFLKDKRRMIPYIPLLFNMLAILLLVTGGETRFVFANLTAGIPIALFTLTPKEDYIKIS